MPERAFEAQQLVSSSDFVQKYKRSANNIMVIARMPEDRSKTIQKPVKHRFKTFKAIYTCT
eukprot:4918213-Heterocapsa_arctica.AAC.1